MNKHRIHVFDELPMTMHQFYQFILFPTGQIRTLYQRDAHQNTVQLIRFEVAVTPGFDQFIPQVVVQFLPIGLIVSFQKGLQ